MIGLDMLNETGSLPFFILIGITVFLSGVSCYFAAISSREGNKRAARIGTAMFLLCLILLSMMIIFPITRLPIFLTYCILGILFIVIAFPAGRDKRWLTGTDAHIEGTATRIDERDTPFSRMRSLQEGSDAYRQYYGQHPELEKPDAERRKLGILGPEAKIDGEYAPAVAAIDCTRAVPMVLRGLDGKMNPDGIEPVGIGPSDAAKAIKQLALHLGADAVGICKLKPIHVYSHRGEVKDPAEDIWGQDIDAEKLPQYAVVILTEMRYGNNATAPHSATTIETLTNYAKGAYITAIMAEWFRAMGYKGIPQNTGRYDTLMPPLAVDAGLGEIGRFGYLVTPRFGGRVRIFAVLTDMQLMVDKPVSLGIDEYCVRCLKCAECCPSNSVPAGEKTLTKGVRSWKIQGDSCFAYWAKVGTDCGICMAVCPFSRPDNAMHNMMRWMVEHSPVARRLLPAMDNLVYGRKWHPKPQPDWLIPK